MIRTKFIRAADSIDLQNKSASPTPQDISRSVLTYSLSGLGSQAPPHSEDLHELSAELEENQQSSPRSNASETSQEQILLTQNDIEVNNNIVLSSNSNKSRQIISKHEGEQEGSQARSTGDDSELANSEVDDGLDDDNLDKISSSPSIEDEEDIDFEFVYALHTFVATIEGQANAIKGDTMVLLDDSNSYWWLVRVVKDSSIGYLPAEHIETPTERLARLNKHRNIDLTSAMLGDQPEKYKNPLKKAFRKRGTRSVAFAEPTYVEASENEFSTEDDGDDTEYYGHMTLWDQTSDYQERVTDDENSSLEPQKTQSESREAGIDDSEEEANTGSNDSSNIRTSDEILDGRAENKSRNGTLRNTDSFFRDESVETRKITLTPNLLRDDSSPSAIRVSNELKERRSPSLDKIDKDLPERGKEKRERKDKKEKDKKSGMLSGLFKRKERKNKSVDEDIDEIWGSKHSNDISPISPIISKESDESMEDQSSVKPQEISTASSDPQKQSVVDGSITSKSSNGKESKEMEPNSITGNDTACDDNLPAPDTTESLAEQAHEKSPESSLSTTASKESKSGNAISKILRTGGSVDSRPVKLKKAKSRVELDDFDSISNSPVDSKPQSAMTPENSIEALNQNQLTESSTQGEEKLSESVAQEDSANESQPHLPTLLVESLNHNGLSSPTSSTSSDSILAEDPLTKLGVGTSTSGTTTVTWSDINLRTFFDDDSEIKDLLIVVHDNSGVVPAGPEHPIAGGLFKEENAKLAEIASRLDGILESWLARKSRSLGRRS